MECESRAKAEYPYPFTPQSISINGHSYSYLDEGQGEVIVMLHGNPTWSFFYRNLAALLGKQYRVIVPDHLGCGFSDKPQDYPYTLADHIENVQTLLARLDIDSFSLVVHDWGGAIGMGVAVANPGRIQAMVVMNTAAFRSKRIPLRISLCRTPYLGALLVRGLNGFARAATFMAVTKTMNADIIRGYLAPYDSWANRIAVHRFVRDIPLTGNDQSWPTLAAIEKGLETLREKPTLILWGGADFCFTRHFFDEWVRRFPGAESRYFPDAGHYLLEDAFDQVAPLISTFFDTNLPQTHD